MRYVPKWKPHPPRRVRRPDNKFSGSCCGVVSPAGNRRNKHGLILIILVAGLVVWLVGHNHAVEHTTCGTVEAAPPDTALEVLRKRYARGEIDKAEYEERKSGLA